MNKPKIGFLIYTYNRIDDALISMELIENIWKKSGLFSDIKIIHCYNGDKKWYSTKYLEDDLVRIKNPGHFQGASELIDAGMKVFQRKYKNLDYVIVLAADTWLLKPGYVQNMIQKMIGKKLNMATCAWGNPSMKEIRDAGMATDFFIVDLQWVKKFKMFPIDYAGFYKKFGELLLYLRGYNTTLEKLIFVRYLQAIKKQYNIDVALRDTGLSKIYMMEDREPVHLNDKWFRKAYWPKMGLVTHHEPELKKKILKESGIVTGKNIKKLLVSKSLDYYNRGIRKFKNIN